MLFVPSLWDFYVRSEFSFGRRLNKLPRRWRPTFGIACDWDCDLDSDRVYRWEKVADLCRGGGEKTPKTPAISPKSVINQVWFIQNMALMIF